MNLQQLAFKNLGRNKLRTLLTILGVALAVLTFVMLRTVVTAWYTAVDFAAKDRIASRNKVSFVVTVPKRYVEEIREVPGVVEATWANWTGMKDPNRPNEFFSVLAVEPKSFAKVYDEMSLTPGELEAWVSDKRSAVVGDVIAKKLGVKVGDKVTLEGTIYPGNIEFNVAGVYKATRRSLDRSQFLFHWDYLNDGLPAFRQDQIGWIVARVNTASGSADISRKIDQKFENTDIPTLTMSEKAMNNSFMGMFAGILGALDIICVIMLGVLGLLLGNTISMGVRERTQEYGVLRAVGFLPKHVMMFIVSEAVFMGLIAAAMGIVISYPIVEWGMGRFLEEEMGGWFPYFRIAGSTLIAATLLSVFLSVVAGVLPGLRASKLSVLDSLRKVG